MFDVVGFECCDVDGVVGVVDEVEIASANSSMMKKNQQHHRPLMSHRLTSSYHYKAHISAWAYWVESGLWPFVVVDVDLSSDAACGTFEDDIVG